MNGNRAVERLWDRIEWLSTEIAEFSWADSEIHRINIAGFSDIDGSVDTVPVYVSTTAKFNAANALYSGKYHDTVLKFQVVVSNGGLPLWWSGPHPGRAHDARIAVETPPPVPAGRTILGDAAYVSVNPSILPPFKKSPGKALSFEEKKYNRVHQWYRATVEHFFAYVKRFRVLSTRYRCKPGTDSFSRTSVARLHAAFAVIIHACAAYVRVRPRRDLEQTRTRLYATIHAMNEKHAAGQEVSDGDDADAESGSEARARPRGVRRAPPPDLYIDSGTCNCFHPTRHPLSHANGLFACSICRL